MKNNDAITVMDAPVGIDRINEKKYPKTADNIPIMTENINTLLSFSVKNSEVSGGRAIRPNTGRAPNALVVTATMTPIVSNKIEFRNLIGYLIECCTSCYVIQGQNFYNFNIILFFINPFRNEKDLIGIPKIALRKLGAKT